MGSGGLLVNFLKIWDKLFDQLFDHVQIAFLKFTSCDSQALVECIPIPAVAVDLKLKS